MSCQPDENTRSRSLSPESLGVAALRIAHDQANHALSLWHVTPGAVTGARLSHWEWPRPDLVPSPAPQSLVAALDAAGEADPALAPWPVYGDYDDLDADCGTLSMLLGWSNLSVMNAGSQDEFRNGGPEGREPDGKNPT